MNSFASGPSSVTPPSLRTPSIVFVLPMVSVAKNHGIATVYVPFEDAPEVFRFFADYVATAPEELSVTASTFRAALGFPVPTELVGELVTMLAICYAGDIAEGERVLKPLRSFGRPLPRAVVGRREHEAEVAHEGARPDAAGSASCASVYVRSSKAPGPLFRRSVGWGG